MNPLELLQHDPNWILTVKLENYGKTIVNDEIMSKHFNQGEDEIVDIIAFNELEQGCETWFKGEKFPVRGCLQQDRIRQVLIAKRTVPTILRTLKTPLDILYIYKHWKEYLNLIDKNLLDVYYPESKLYSVPVYELYKSISHEIIRNIICAFLEFDTAYRYRVQHILGKIDRGILIINPIKELKRLFEIYSKSEGGGFIQRKFGKAIPILFIYLRFNKKLLKEIQETLLRIDVKNIKLNEADIYWTQRVNYGYNFNG